MTLVISRKWEGNVTRLRRRLWLRQGGARRPCRRAFCSKPGHRGIENSVVTILALGLGQGCVDLLLPPHPRPGEANAMRPCDRKKVSSSASGRCDKASTKVSIAVSGVGRFHCPMASRPRGPSLSMDQTPTSPEASRVTTADRSPPSRRAAIVSLNTSSATSGTAERAAWLGSLPLSIALATATRILPTRSFDGGSALMSQTALLRRCCRRGRLQRAPGRPPSHPRISSASDVLAPAPGRRPLPILVNRCPDPAGARGRQGGQRLGGDRHRRQRRGAPRGRRVRHWSTSSPRPGSTTWPSTSSTPPTTSWPSAPSPPSTGPRSGQPIPRSASISRAGTCGGKTPPLRYTKLSREGWLAPRLTAGSTPSSLASRVP